VDAERVVGVGDAAKSIGHEHTFDVDTSDRETLERTLLAMSDGVAARLRTSGLRAATVTVKIRDSTFRTITRQRTLTEPTDLTEPIYRAALELARREMRGQRIRLLGVTASHFGESDQLGLFAADDPRRRRVVEATDAVRRRFGERAMTRARLIGSRLPAPFERDPGTAPERRGEHAADVAERPSRRRSAPVAPPADRDSQGDTDGSDDGPAALDIEHPFD
jgi:DNA polymerase-4